MDFCSGRSNWVWLGFFFFGGGGWRALHTPLLFDRALKDQRSRAFPSLLPSPSSSSSPLLLFGGCSPFSKYGSFSLHDPGPLPSPPFCHPLSHTTAVSSSCQTAKAEFTTGAKIEVVCPWGCLSLSSSAGRESSLALSLFFFLPPTPFLVTSVSPYGRVPPASPRETPPSYEEKMVLTCTRPSMCVYWAYSAGAYHCHTIYGGRGGKPIQNEAQVMHGSEMKMQICLCEVPDGLRLCNAGRSVQFCWFASAIRSSRLQNGLNVNCWTSWWRCLESALKRINALTSCMYHWNDWTGVLSSGSFSNSHQGQMCMSSHIFFICTCTPTKQSETAGS